MAIYVDHTHLGRHVTGLERITLELFSVAALAPLKVTPVTARGTVQMVTTQTLGLPMRLAASASILLRPGFPQARCSGHSPHGVLLPTSMMISWCRERPI